MRFSVFGYTFEARRSHIFFRFPYIGEFFMEIVSACPGAPRVVTFDRWSKVKAIEERWKAKARAADAEAKAWSQAKTDDQAEPA